MRTLLSASVMFLLFCAPACSRDEGPRQDVSWRAQCSTDGINLSSPDDMRVISAMAVECEPIGACTLACFRSGCYKGVKRNCFHTCTPLAPEAAMKEAAWQFANGSHDMCRPAT